MKKYIFASLVSVLTLFTSCKEDFEPTYLDNIRVSSSYVSIPVAGGQTSITVTTQDAWTLTCCDTCQVLNQNHTDTKGKAVAAKNWLKADVTSGNAGTSTITFSAEQTLDGRTIEVLLKSAGNVQRINVVQGLPTVSSATCAEVLAGPDDKTYRVKGVCTSIANTSYGNFYINDGTGDLYIYGTVDDAGAYNWAKFGIEVGDEVTVQGPKVTYNGTVELKDATFISVSKSLIKVDSVSIDNLSSDGGITEVFLVNKGTNLYIDIPEDAQSWLSIKQVAGDKVVFNATSNTAGPRTTTLTFRTISGGKTYSAETTISQDGLSGTLNVPFTVEEAIAAANKGITGEVYIKGIVSKIADKGEFGSYGNGSFWISSDGNYNDDLSKDFEAYRALWLGNKNWAEGNAQIAVGQEVIICGKLTTYNGVAETVSKAAYVYSINGVTTDENGVGSLAHPFNTYGAIAAANSGTKNNVYIQGIVSKVQSQFTAAYGNGTFWISVDGTSSVSADGKSTTDKAHDFEVYRALWFGNQKWTEGNPTVAEGDNVIVFGQLTVYNGIAETNSGKAYVYSLNGKTE